MKMHYIIAKKEVSEMNKEHMLHLSRVMNKYIFNVFESILCPPRLHLFGQKYIKNSNIENYYNLKQLFLI